MTTARRVWDHELPRKGVVLKDHQRSTGSDLVFQYERLVALTGKNFRFLQVQRQQQHVHALPGLWLGSQPRYEGRVVDALDLPGAPSNEKEVVQGDTAQHLETGTHLNSGWIRPCMGEPGDPLHCTQSLVHGRVSTRYAKIDTDLGDVVHRQHSPTCPYTVLYGVSGGSLNKAADKLKNFRA